MPGSPLNLKNRSWYDCNFDIDYLYLQVLLRNCLHDNLYIEKCAKQQHFYRSLGQPYQILKNRQYSKGHLYD